MSSGAHPKAKLLVVYYSLYGHIATLADQIAEGAKSNGAEVTIRQIAETLPAEVLTKMHAPPRKDIPNATPEDLAAADAIIFGIPTRFGAAPAQVKALLDSTGQLWAKGALVGKVASVFFSTGSQSGGQETTALTFYTQFVHHGMIVVPIGYSSPLLFNLDEVHGGSPYGAGTIAGPTGARQPSKLELDVAHHQGKYVANVANELVAGRAALAASKL